MIETPVYDKIHLWASWCRFLNTFASTQFELKCHVKQFQFQYCLWLLTAIALLFVVRSSSVVRSWKVSITFLLAVMSYRYTKPTCFRRFFFYFVFFVLLFICIHKRYGHGVRRSVDDSTINTGVPNNIQINGRDLINLSTNNE